MGQISFYAKMTNDGDFGEHGETISHFKVSKFSSEKYPSANKNYTWDSANATSNGVTRHILEEIGNTKLLTIVKKSDAAVDALLRLDNQSYKKNKNNAGTTLLFFELKTTGVGADRQTAKLKVPAVIYVGGFRENGTNYTVFTLKTGESVEITKD